MFYFFIYIFIPAFDFLVGHKMAAFVRAKISDILVMTEPLY